jgi:hypothetical protein
MVNILTAVLTDGLAAVEAACIEAIAQGVHSALMKLEEFYQICDAIEPDEYGCINYLGAYGNRTLGVCHAVKINGKDRKASRLALERKLGRPIKPGYLACHHCDNPSCVNQDHIYEGTQSDNIKDIYKRNTEYLEYKKRHDNSLEFRELMKGIGRKGGTARARNLTKERLSEIARKAQKARVERYWAEIEERKRWVEERLKNQSSKKPNEPE